MLNALSLGALQGAAPSTAVLGAIPFSPALFNGPVALIAVLCLCVVVSEFLALNTPLRHAGTALTVIVLTAVVANLGIIPTSTGTNATYGALFHEVAWLAIFWLLLEVDLKRIWKGARSLLPLFLLACAATSVAALLASLIFDLPGQIDDYGAALTGMFTGTYTGGSVNFVALASHYEVSDGVLMAAANAVDAALTTVWMAVTLFIPKVLRSARTMRTKTSAPTRAIEGDGRLSTTSLGLLGGLGLGTVWLADTLPGWIEPMLGFKVPGILVLTTIALILAQLPIVSRLRGSRLLGMFAVYLFLAVIGALCDLDALRSSGDVAILVASFAVTLLLIHGVVLFGSAKLLGGDIEAASVASQAAVGGGATALVLARSLKREDLELPSILVGALGNALGTYLGLLVVFIIQS